MSAAAQPPVLIECVCPSCKADVQTTPARARKLGWRRVQPSKPVWLVPGAEPRTHIGFCPECAERFGVEE